MCLPGYFSPREKSDAGQGKWLPLEGIERLDGTLFVRAARLTLDQQTKAKRQVVGIGAGRVPHARCVLVFQLKLRFLAARDFSIAWGCA